MVDNFIVFSFYESLFLFFFWSLCCFVFGFLACLFVDMEDMIKKGRKRFGVPKGSRCLNQELAEAIRADYGAGMTYSELRKKYQTSKSQISRVVLRQIWK